MPTLAKPQTWWPGCDVLHPLCSDFTWPVWERVGSRVGCVGKDIGNLNRYPGHLKNGATWEGGPFGSQVALDHTSTSHIDCGGILNLSDTNFTYSALFIEHSWPSKYSGLVSSGGYLHGWCLYHVSATAWRVILANVGHDWIVTTQGLGPKHLLVRRIGTSVSLWCDGVQIGSPFAMAQSGVGDEILRFGCRSSAAGAPEYGLDGNIIAVWIWPETALDDSQIQQLYADPFAALRWKRRVFPVAAPPPTGNPYYAYAQQSA